MEDLEDSAEGGHAIQLMLAANAAQELDEEAFQPFFGEEVPQ